MSSRRGALPFLLTISGLVLLSFAYLLYGRYPAPGFTPPSALLADEMARRIIMTVRLPRLFAAILSGGTLAVTGCVFQLLFANPLVDAGFLGVTQGASFGAALAFSLAFGAAGVFGFSFAFALLALGMSVFLASRIRFGGSILRLILSGIAVSAFFSAAVAYVKYSADPMRELPDMMYWMMGSLAGVGWTKLAVIAPVSLACTGILVLARWRTSLLSLDEPSAKSLGAKPRLERALMLGVAATGVSTITAAAGPVSWVGLIVPHLARIALGSEGAASIPLSALFGAAFVIVCDMFARGLLPGELPLGIMTAFIGTIVFFMLLVRKRIYVERK